MPDDSHEDDGLESLAGAARAGDPVLIDQEDVHVQLGRALVAERLLELRLKIDFARDELERVLDTSTAVHDLTRHIPVLRPQAQNLARMLDTQYLDSTTREQHVRTLDELTTELPEVDEIYDLDLDAIDDAIAVLEDRLSIANSKRVSHAETRRTIERTIVSRIGEVLSEERINGGTDVADQLADWLSGGERGQRFDVRDSITSAMLGPAGSVARSRPSSAGTFDQQSGWSNLRELVAGGGDSFRRLDSVLDSHSPPREGVGQPSDEMLASSRSLELAISRAEGILQDGENSARRRFDAVAEAFGSLAQNVLVDALLETTLKRVVARRSEPEARAVIIDAIGAEADRARSASQPYRRPSQPSQGVEIDIDTLMSDALLRLPTTYFDPSATTTDDGSIDLDRIVRSFGMNPDPLAPRSSLQVLSPESVQSAATALEAQCDLYSSGWPTPFQEVVEQMIQVVADAMESDHELRRRIADAFADTRTRPPGEALAVLADTTAGDALIAALVEHGHNLSRDMQSAAIAKLTGGGEAAVSLGKRLAAVFADAHGDLDEVSRDLDALYGALSDLKNDRNRSSGIAVAHIASNWAAGAPPEWFKNVELDESDDLTEADRARRERVELDRERLSEHISDPPTDELNDGAFASLGLSDEETRFERDLRVGGSAVKPLGHRLLRHTQGVCSEAAVVTRFHQETLRRLRDLLDTTVPDVTATFVDAYRSRSGSRGRVEATLGVLGIDAEALERRAASINKAPAKPTSARPAPLGLQKPSRRTSLSTVGRKKQSDGLSVDSEDDLSGEPAAVESQGPKRTITRPVRRALSLTTRPGDSLNVYPFPSPLTVHDADLRESTLDVVPDSGMTEALESKNTDGPDLAGGM